MHSSHLVPRGAVKLPQSAVAFTMSVLERRGVAPGVVTSAHPRGPHFGSWFPWRRSVAAEVCRTSVDSRLLAAGVCCGAVLCVVRAAWCCVVLCVWLCVVVRR